MAHSSLDLDNSRSRIQSHSSPGTGIVYSLAPLALQYRVSGYCVEYDAEAGIVSARYTLRNPLEGRKALVFRPSHRATQKHVVFALQEP